MSVGDGEVCESVELQPFPHQVGGHTTMFRYSQDTVCKPLCLREFHFYSTLPPELLPFTAECRGIVHVEVQGLGTENVRLLAHRVMGPGGDHLRSSQGSLQDSKVKGSKLKTNGELEDEPGIQSRQQNPWVQDVFTRQLRRLSPSGANKFLLLENMVAGFQKPCVLDLKMGRRQHGDDATPEKIQLFRERCATSTSNLLGVRASGMQVYQVDSGQFIFRNKYDGRALNSHEFKANLYQFLHNGLVLRRDLLAPIIEQLTQLRHVVENLPTFRFYSSSLLIMYEGVSAEKRNRGSSKHEHCDKKSYHVDETDSCGWCYDDRVIVKMVDFAHTTYKDFDSGDQNHTGPHSGYLFGLSTLITVFTELQQQHGNPKCQLAPDDSYDI